MNIRRLWYGTPPGRLLRGYYSVDPVVTFIDAYSVGDGGTFSGHILPVLQADSQKPIFHVSYVNKERSVVLNKIDSHANTLFSQFIWTQPLRLASEAMRAGEGVKSWRFFGSKMIPYRRRDYPRMFLDWATREGLEYVH